MFVPHKTSNVLPPENSHFNSKSKECLAKQLDILKLILNRARSYTNIKQLIVEYEIFCVFKDF